MFAKFHFKPPKKIWNIEFPQHNVRAVQRPNLPCLGLLGFRGGRLHRLHLLLRQGERSGNRVRSSTSEVHQRVNAVPAERTGRHHGSDTKQITTASPLTWRPPGTCQAPKGRRGNTWKRSRCECYACRVSYSQRAKNTRWWFEVTWAELPADRRV